MDLIVLFSILVLIIIFFRDAKSLIYGLGIIEIFLRLLEFLVTKLNVAEINKVYNAYMPRNILDIFDGANSLNQARDMIKEFLE